MTRLTFSGIPDPVEVELLGTEYVSTPVTRAVSRKIDELAPVVDEEMYREIPDQDKVIDGLAKLLDLRLKPSEGTVKASTLINKAWKSDELDFRALFRFWVQFQEAERPAMPEVDSDTRPT